MCPGGQIGHQPSRVFTTREAAGPVRARGRGEGILHGRVRIGAAETTLPQVSTCHSNLTV